MQCVDQSQDPVAQEPYKLGKKPKVKKAKAPEKMFTPWTESSFEGMRTGTPEPLQSSFKVGMEVQA